MCQRVCQRTRIDHSLEDEDLTQRAAHVPRRVSDLAECHIFFALQVVEIATETGRRFRWRKITLAIAVDVDILPCPLGSPDCAFSVGEFSCATVCRTKAQVKLSSIIESTRENF